MPNCSIPSQVKFKILASNPTGRNYIKIRNNEIASAIKSFYDYGVCVCVSPGHTHTHTHAPPIRSADKLADKCRPGQGKMRVAYFAVGRSMVWVEGRVSFGYDIPLHGTRCKLIISTLAANVRKGQANS